MKKYRVNLGLADKSNPFEQKKIYIFTFSFLKNLGKATVCLEWISYNTAPVLHKSHLKCDLNCCKFFATVSSSNSEGKHCTTYTPYKDTESQIIEAHWFFIDLKQK